MTITAGPLTFEPHAGYGHDLGVDMRMPFGYITSPDYKPLFELDHFFDCPPEQLAAYAQLFAGSWQLLDAAREAVLAIKRMDGIIGQVEERDNPWNDVLRQLRAAIRNADGTTAAVAAFAAAAKATA